MYDLAVFDKGSGGNSTKRFLESAKKFGLSTTSISWLDIRAVADVSTNKLNLFLGNQPMPKIKSALFRMYPGKKAINNIMKEFIDSGVKIIDTELYTAHQGFIGGDKFTTQSTLAKLGISTPKTLFTPEPLNISFVELQHFLNSEMVVMKPSGGGRGEGIFLIKDQATLTKHLLELDEQSRKEIIFQEYLEHSGDYRIHVIGGRIIGAIFRQKTGSDFRANIKQGATAKPVNMNDIATHCELAIKAANACYFSVCGVDIMESNGKLYVIETNRSPQFGGFEQATGINYTDEVIKYVMTLI